MMPQKPVNMLVVHFGTWPNQRKFVPTHVFLQGHVNTWIVDGSRACFCWELWILTFQTSACSVWRFMYHWYFCSGRITNQCLCLLLGFLLNSTSRHGYVSPRTVRTLYSSFFLVARSKTYEARENGVRTTFGTRCMLRPSTKFDSSRESFLLDQPVPGQRFGAPSHWFGRALKGTKCWGWIKKKPTMDIQIHT